MNCPIAILVALHVLWHAVAGCCWHPVAAQRAEGVCAALQLAAFAPCHGHSPGARHDHHHGDQVPQDNGSNEPHACCHDLCQWISESAGPDVELLASSDLVLFAEEMECASARLEHLTRLDRDHNDHPAALPVRLHLAVGILLI